MRSTITERRQTVVSAEIRRQLHLGPADPLEWVVDSQGIRVVSVRANPIAVFRGPGRDGRTPRLLQDRREELAQVGHTTILRALAGWMGTAADADCD